MNTLTKSLIAIISLILVGIFMYVTIGNTSNVAEPINNSVEIEINEPVENGQSQDASPQIPAAASESKSKIFLEMMVRDLGINSAVSPEKAPYQNNFIGYGIKVSTSQEQYLRTKLPIVLPEYTSETSMGFSNGVISCINQGIRLPSLEGYLMTTHYEIVCADLISTTENIPNSNQTLIETAKNILSILRAKDYTELENQISPQGLSLSNYVYWLNLNEFIIQKDSISEIPSSNTVYTVGYTDGKDNPIKMTLAAFFDQINETDYLSREIIVVNEPAPSVSVFAPGRKNSIIAQTAAGRYFVGFHSEGNPSYPIWNTLYLVFDKVGDEYKLRAITKDNWTI